MSINFESQLSKTFKYGALVIALAATGGLVAGSGAYALPGCPPSSNFSNSLVILVKNGITSGTFGGGLTIVKPKTKTQDSENDSNTGKITSNTGKITSKQTKPIGESLDDESELEPN